jgi:ATP-dependent phosphoenolpyruvate carboxykinase
VVAEMSRISSLPAAAKTELFLKLHNIADRNQQHFFNNLFEQVQTEYVNNMQNAMVVMNQHCTDQHRRELKTQSSSDYTALSILYDRSMLD